MANLFDRLIGAISPDAGLRRYRARELLTRAYEGASQRDGWRPRRAGASANADHRGDAATLRVRARSLVQNVPYMSRALESLVAHTIGTGITPYSLAPNAEEVDALWNEWVKVCDADGRMNFYGMQAAAYRAMEQDGEVLIRMRTRRVEDGLPVPLQLQLLEIDWLDSSKSGKVGPNTVVNGIEYDPLGRIQNYWLYDQHPGDTTSITKSRTGSYPVPADRIIHLFTPQRPGQGRGITRFAPVIARVRDIQLYEDAELQRKNLETRLSVIAGGDVAELSLNPSDDINTVRKTGELGQISSGSITHVPYGTNLTVIEPKVAPGYVDYIKYNLHLVAAGFGVTYEMMTGDGAEGNFSSNRGLRQDFRKGVESTQWLTFVPQMCERVYDAFAESAILASKLRKAKYLCDWSTPKWEYVNPEQDVKAELAEISGGLSSISEKLRRRGYKPNLVFKEIKSDFDRLRSDGTLDILLQILTGQAAQSEKDQPAKAAKRQFEDATHRIDQQLSSVRADIASLSRQQPVPAGVAVAVDVSGTAMERAFADATAPLIEQFTNAARQVLEREMTTIVQVPQQAPPTVNVTVEAAQVTVQPAEVVVNNTHPTRAVQVVERDKDDEITRTVTTFEK